VAASKVPQQRYPATAHADPSHPGYPVAARADCPVPHPGYPVATHADYHTQVTLEPTRESAAAAVAPSHSRYPVAAEPGYPPPALTRPCHIQVTLEPTLGARQQGSNRPVTFTLPCSCRARLPTPSPHAALPHPGYPGAHTWSAAAIAPSHSRYPAAARPGYPPSPHAALPHPGYPGAHTWSAAAARRPVTFASRCVARRSDRVTGL
jgi:hypothetical protein